MSSTIFGSTFPDLGGSAQAISVAQSTPTQLALTERRIHKTTTQYTSEKTISFKTELIRSVAFLRYSVWSLLSTCETG